MAEDSDDPTDEMLVGYVRGRLPEAEAGHISALAAERPELAARIALAAAIAADVDAEAAGPGPGEFGWRRIARALDAEAAPQPARRALWGFAAAAAAVVLLWQVSALMQDKPEPGYAPVSQHGSDRPEVSVAFSPQLAEAELRDLLRSVGAEVVGGPSAVGLWRLGFADAAARDAALARLTRDPRVESAQAD
jgi:anti-sigma factor RsiW